MMLRYQNQNWCMPHDAPTYPTPPAYYRDTLTQSVVYTTDRDNIAKVLPSSLEPADDGLCIAFGIKVPFCTHWGPFNEVGVCVKAVYQGQEGFFLPCLFLNSSDAIAPGREIWGCPKKFADITVDQHGGELTSTATRAGVQFMQMNSRCMEPATPEELPPMFPMFLLKVIPKIDSPEPAIKQLCLNGEPFDVTTHKLFKGPGVVNYQPTVSGDFWKLQPKEFLGSFYQVADFSQGHGEVLHDYLADPQ